MRQIFYGSHYGYQSPDPPSSGFGENPDRTSEGFGFRLVHDGGSRVERGGSSLLNCGNARQSRSFWANPAFPSGARGLRLAREDT